MSKLQLLEKKNKLVKKAGDFCRYKKLQATVFAYGVLAPVEVSVSAKATTADAQWNNFTDFLEPWIKRMGGIITVIGLVEFGMGWKNDDPEAKTKGIRTVIAGCIVLAVGVSADKFLQ